MPLRMADMWLTPARVREQVPLAPPEDILSWLTRIGLLEVEDGVAEEDDGFGAADSLLEDEFDLDDDAAPAAESAL